VTDDNRNQWALCIDFKQNEVNLWRLEDCIMKEGAILSNITQFLGMHKILKNTVITIDNLIYKNFNAFREKTFEELQNQSKHLIQCTTGNHQIDFDINYLELHQKQKDPNK